ncbi:MAG: DUF6580 family putative transport protein [Verrucomicrobiota bacterium]
MVSNNIEGGTLNTGGPTSKQKARNNVIAALVLELVIPVARRMIFTVKGKIVLPLILLAVFAISRWPGLMPQNFSAAYAIAFCAGLYLPKRLAWWIPLGVLLATDLVINLFFYHTDAFHISMLGNYLAFAAIIWLGHKFRRTTSWLGLLGGGVMGAIIFYLITNTAAWLQLPQYPKTLAGLIQALTVGTPGWPHTWEFFRNTLLSGGLFTGLFAGAMKLEEKAESEEPETASAESDEQPENAS